MKKFAAVWSLGAMAVMGAGCGSSPLVGTWVSSTTTDTMTVTGTLELMGGGDVNVSLAMGGCTGTLSANGAHWSSDATTITFSGTPTCSGSISCPGWLHPVDCNTQGFSLLSPGTESYALSGDNMTLTLTSNGSASTYTRQH